MEKTVFDYAVNQLLKSELIRKPVPISGGLTHKVFCVATTQGKYALKLLAKPLTATPEAKEAFVLHEKLGEQICTAAGLNGVFPLEFNGKTLHTFEDECFFVYDWYDGYTAQHNAVTTAQLQKMGEMLATVHIAGTTPEALHFASLQNGSKTTAAKTTLPLVASHCDMDIPNVLWSENAQPVILDWELSGLVNPYSELVRTALYWNGYINCSINFAGVEVFARAYKKRIEKNSICTDCAKDDADDIMQMLCQTGANTALNAAIADWQDWIAFNEEKAKDGRYKAADRQAAADEVAKQNAAIKNIVLNCGEILKIFKNIFGC
ncbi:MAG: phosphotransferase [Oscillospiraceae bacterium]|jgi:hypothetical protein|nr:phosphotransferase [Oscillospiraceae bacterium]